MRKKIGDFQIGKTIGEGTFGKVHIATHTPTGQKVAIKILEKTKITEKQDLRRVQRQLTILKKLDHPNVIQLLELHETEQKIYIVTEYMEGHQLYHVIVKEGYLPESVCKNYFAQLINAVNYLHSHGICHRDIKPENIIVSEQKLKLIDFGLSREFGHNQMLSTSCGSPCYAAPQMLLGCRYDGIKSDIWACGVTLYAMAAGRLPFEHKKTSRLYQLVNEGKYDPIQCISAGFMKLIDRILETDPVKRFSLQQISSSEWLKDQCFDGVKEEENDEILLKSMTKIFGESKQRLRKIIETKSIPSIHSYYFLMKNNLKNQPPLKKPSQTINRPIHLNLLFEDLSEIEKWISLRKGFTLVNEEVVSFQGLQYRISQVENCGLLYLELPSYFNIDSVE